MPASRGRPAKFGRPATAMALTLPENVLAWLGSIHSDPAWAIVALCKHAGRIQRPPRAHVELVPLAGPRALIVINPLALKAVAGASTIPLAGGRALIALKPGKGVADFELAMMDRLQRVPSGTSEHTELSRLHQSLRRWRRVDGCRFHMRSIIVVERAAIGQAARSLPSIGRPRRRPRPKKDRPRRDAEGTEPRLR